MTRLPRILAAILVGALIIVGGVVFAHRASPPPEASRVEMPPEPPEATAQQVRQACAGCHAYPPPESFPRFAWRNEITQAYDFLHEDPTQPDPFPPLPSVLRYYENRAPDTLPALSPFPNVESPVPFERRGYQLPNSSAMPGITYVGLVRLGE